MNKDLKHLTEAYEAVLEGLMGCRCTCDECVDGMCKNCTCKKCRCKGCRCAASKVNLSKEEREQAEANDYLIKKVDNS